MPAEARKADTANSESIQTCPVVVFKRDIHVTMSVVRERHPLKNTAKGIATAFPEA